MKELPNNVESYKSTKTFDEESIPKGLLNDHKTMSGVWGKIVIIEGKLRYVIKSTPTEEIFLDKEKFGVVEPEVLHYVEPVGSVRFFVEFFR